MVNTKKDDTAQARILSAAKKIFLKQGMAGARMQDIADEAGINKALLHYYFRNKEILFDMIFLEALNQFFPKISEVVQSDISLFDKIEIFCREYITTMQQNAYFPLFVLNEVNKDPVRFKEKFWKGKDIVFLKFVEQIELEMKKGKIKPVNPGHLFINMVSMCIFPFIAKPMWMMTTDIDEMQFRYFMEQRKTEVSKFIIESIKK